MIAVAKRQHAGGNIITPVETFNQICQQKLSVKDKAEVLFEEGFAIHSMIIAGCMNKGVSNSVLSQ